MATIKCITNLRVRPITITVTTKDIDTFSSVRLYLSTVTIDNIKTKPEEKDEKQTLYDIYKMRWNIDVMLYQQKLFWSFGSYIVRSKVSILKKDC